LADISRDCGDGVLAEIHFAQVAECNDRFIHVAFQPVVRQHDLGDVYHMLMWIKDLTLHAGAQSRIAWICNRVCARTPRHTIQAEV
jgi:hypothetical protein